MKYVLDSSVALKWVFNETDSAIARKLQGEFQRLTIELVAPDIFPIEVSHVLSKAHRTRAITAERANADLVAILVDAPRLHSSTLLLPRAFELALQFRISLYDCLYVALAEREGCDLVTADQRLLASLPGSPIVSLSTL